MFSGPSLLGIMVSPVLGVKLKDWNIGSEPLKVNTPWNGRDTYFIYYCLGQDPVPFIFTMNYEVF